MLEIDIIKQYAATEYINDLRAASAIMRISDDAVYYADLAAKTYCGSNLDPWIYFYNTDTELHLAAD